MASLLSVQGLCVDHHNQRLVDNLCFELAQGEVMGVLGQSGAGKTLAMMALLGIGDGLCMTANATLLNWQLPIGDTAHQRWQRIRGHCIGYIFQDPKRTLNPVHTIKTAFTHVLSQANIPKAQHRQRTLELLTWVRLPNPARFLSHYAHQLSGGEAQRIAIALVLALNPMVVIADEPTSSLDDALKHDILCVLKDIAKQKKCGVIIISHDTKHLFDIADKFLVMAQGKPVLTTQSPAQVQNSAYLTADFGKPSEFCDTKVVLEVKDLSLSYRSAWFGKGLPVVSGLNFTMQQGQMVGLMGVSGRGKSSIAKAITRLDDALMIQGEIKFFDTLFGECSVTKLKGRQLSYYRPKVLLMTQEVIASLNPRRRIIQSLTESIEQDHHNNDVSVLDDLMPMVGLDKSILACYPNQLSGGECARVCLLRALLVQPKILILDEPTAMLDRQTTKQVVDLLRNINQTFKMSMLLISHDKAVVQALCHYVVRL